MMAKVINKLIEYGFYTLFALTPFIFNISRTFPSFELFEWNKMMFVYALTVFIVGSWGIRMAIHKKIIFARTPFTFPILLFLLSQILATVFSIDPHVSLWGYYSRFHGGLLSTITYSLLYFAFVSNRDLISFPKLLTFTLISGAGVALYGILEKFGIDAHMWVQDVRARVFSTLGQPNWLAAYLAILLPITIGQGLRSLKANHETTDLMQQSKVKNQNDNSKSKIGPPAGRWLYWVIGLLFYICLLFTRSRSGFLGFWMANTILWTTIWFISKKAKPHTLYPKRLFVILNVSFFILNFFLTTPFPQYNRLATIELFQSTPAPIPPPPSTDTIIDVGITDSAKIRSIVWKGAVDIVKTYPLFGTGPETFAYSYYKFRPAEHNLTSEWDFLYNRAHNEFLNVAATSGLIGLGTYLFLILTVIFWTLKSILTIKQLNNVTMIALSLLASYISILVTNFFGFSVVIVGLFFFLIPAFIYSLNHPLVYENDDYTSQTRHSDKPSARPESDEPSDPGQARMTALFHEKIMPLTWISSGFVGIIMFFVLIQLGIIWFADSMYAKSVSFGRLESYPQAYDQINIALTLRHDEPNYYDHKASIATSLALLSLESGESTKSSQYALEAVEMSQTALTLSPQNVNFWKTRTKVFFFLSEIDASFIDDAIASVQIARELAPTDAKIAYNEAVILGRAGKNAEAITALEQAIALKPDYRDAYVALSIFYKEEGQIDKARETLQLVLERINPDDEEIKLRLEELE